MKTKVMYSSYVKINRIGIGIERSGTVNVHFIPKQEYHVNMLFYVCLPSKLQYGDK